MSKKLSELFYCLMFNAQQRPCEMKDNSSITSTCLNHFHNTYCIILTENLRKMKLSEPKGTN